MARRPGRPSKISDVIASRPIVDDDNVPTGEYHDVTVADQIIADVRTGIYAERAARRAGISTSTFYEWEKRGRAAARRIDAGQTTLSKLSAQDRRCLEFSEAVDQAEIEWELRSNATLEQLGRGNLPIRETVTKVDAAGKTIETRTKTSATLPDPSVLQWRLERRFPSRYGRRSSVAHTGHDGGPIAVQVQAEQIVTFARGLLEDLGISLTDDVQQIVASRLRGMSAIDASSTEQDPAAIEA